MLKRKNGFTLVELLIVVVIIIVAALVIGVFGVGVACKGNFWFSEESVLRELKVDHPKVTEILKTQRNVFAKSVIVVMENGVRRDYCLDTNILWNYDFSACSK